MVACSLRTGLVVGAPGTWRRNSEGVLSALVLALYREFFDFYSSQLWYRTGGLPHNKLRLNDGLFWFKTAVLKHSHQFIGYQLAKM